MEDIETAQRIYSNEVTTATHTFFVWKNFYGIVFKEKTLQQAINENALCWNAILHSLQITFFISLGRLFDENGGSFSVHSFLRICSEQIEQFGKAYLRTRKTRNCYGKTPDWLDEFIEQAYEPSPADFRNLKKAIKGQNRIFKEIYQPIRHEIIAHKQITSIESESDLFGKTNIGQIQEMLDTLYQIERIAFDLLHNGRLNKIGAYKFEENDIVLSDVKKLLERVAST